MYIRRRKVFSRLASYKHHDPQPRINIFISRGLRRGSSDSQSAMGVKSLRPTWFEDKTVAIAAAEGSATTREPMHGQRLIIKEDALSLREQPKFEALTEVASRGLLAAETWQSNRPHISLKTTIDVPLLGTVTKWRWSPRRLSYASWMATAP